jgi:hypothetical protein
MTSIHTEIRYLPFFAFASYCVIYTDKILAEHISNLLISLITFGALLFHLLAPTVVLRP